MKIDILTLFPNLFEGAFTESIIKRCVEKKMYQQAVTFIESTMPELFCEKSIVSFNNPKLKEKGSFISTSVEELRVEAKKQIETDNYFSFDRYIFQAHQPFCNSL